MGGFEAYVVESDELVDYVAADVVILFVFAVEVRDAADAFTELLVVHDDL